MEGRKSRGRREGKVGSREEGGRSRKEERREFEERKEGEKIRLIRRIRR